MAGDKGRGRDDPRRQRTCLLIPPADYRMVDKGPRCDLRVRDRSVRGGMGASHFTVLQLLAHLAKLRGLLEEGGEGVQELRWRGVQKALREKGMDLEEVFTLADFEKVLLGTSKEAKEDPLSEQALQVSSSSPGLIFLLLP